MEDNAISLQEITVVQTVCTLEDVVDLVEDDKFEQPVRDAIGRTLDHVQRSFYLVPKSIITVDGSLAKREPPEDSVTQQMSEIWNSVST